MLIQNLLSYLIGGITVGLGVSFIFITTGLHATASSFFDTTISYFSTRIYFQKLDYISTRGWRLTFSIGMIIGALIFTMTLAEGIFFKTSVQWWRLAVGGFLVGFGTRLSQGCTSGHGINGLASLSKTSLLAVITFLSIAIITAIIVQSVGVVP